MYGLGVLAGDIFSFFFSVAHTALSTPWAYIRHSGLYHWKNEEGKNVYDSVHTVWPRTGIRVNGKFLIILVFRAARDVLLFLHFSTHKSEKKHTYYFQSASKTTEWHRTVWGWWRLLCVHTLFLFFSFLLYSWAAGQSFSFFFLLLLLCVSFVFTFHSQLIFFRAAVSCHLVATIGVRAVNWKSCNQLVYVFIWRWHCAPWLTCYHSGHYFFGCRFFVPSFFSLLLCDNFMDRGWHAGMFCFRKQSSACFLCTLSFSCISYRRTEPSRIRHTKSKVTMERDLLLPYFSVNFSCVPDSMTMTI